MSIPSGTSLDLGTFTGVTISVSCIPSNPSLIFESTSGVLRLAGILFDGSTPENKSALSESFIRLVLSGSADNPLHFTGLVRDTAEIESLQLELHVTPADPCQAWGSIVPVG